MEAAKLIVNVKRENGVTGFKVEKTNRLVGRIEPDGGEYACWAVGEPEGTIWHESGFADGVESVSEAIERFFGEYGIEIEYIM